MRNPPPADAPPPDWPDPVQGAKYLRLLHRHARDLRGRADPDPHGNQHLVLDDVFLAHLYAFFNPTLKSLRLLEDFRQTKPARRHLQTPRIARTTLSDFHRLADPALLQPILARLHAAARRRDALPAGLPAAVTRVLAVDGSFFALAADVAGAVRHATNRGRTRAGVRLDVHLDVATGVPEVVDAHGAGVSEADRAARHVRPGAVHVYDRGILSFDLLQAQLDAGAFFVHRLVTPGDRTPKMVVAEERPVTAEQRAAGVVADRRVRYVGSRHRDAPDAVFREVVLAAPTEAGGELRLLTNLDAGVAAATLGLLYRQRWQVELFFRWLKVFAHFEHLLSHSRNGVLLSLYVGVIGVLLICLYTETRPSKYAYALLGQVANGTATLEEVGPILAERHRQMAVDRASRAKRAGQKKLV